MIGKNTITLQYQLNLLTFIVLSIIYSVPLLGFNHGDQGRKCGMHLQIVESNLLFNNEKEKCLEEIQYYLVSFVRVVEQNSMPFCSKKLAILSDSNVVANLCLSLLCIAAHISSPSFSKLLGF